MQRKNRQREQHDVLQATGNIRQHPGRGIARLQRQYADSVLTQTMRHGFGAGLQLLPAQGLLQFPVKCLQRSPIGHGHGVMANG